MENLITIWRIWTKIENNGIQGNEWRHNHISDGYDPLLTSPVPQFENQKGWKSGKWLAIKGMLIDGKVIESED